MSEELDKAFESARKNREQVLEVVDRLFAVAQPGAVYGEPVTSAGYTVITASEVIVGVGVGYGVGGSTGSQPAQGEAVSEDGEGGFGGGGGGGGVSTGRPVATISIGPTGVRVEPVVDVTKIGLALFTTIGAMLIMLGRMRRASRA